jgi:hypothetical protein
MTALPIVERELRAAARRRGTYWMRLAIALLAIFIGAGSFVFTVGLPAALAGQRIFEWLSGLLLFYCLVYGRRATADCLSQEKREGTLGLLFLTDLKGYDVVLGKLAATSLSGFYGLLAVFPVLAIPLLMGGVASGEFWRMVLVLADTFLLSLAIGLFGSALSRTLRGAMAANLLLLLLLLAGPPACAAALGYFLPGRPFVRELFFSCPVYPFALCADVRYRTAPDQFWWSVGVIHGLTWLLVWLAGAVVPRSWQDQPARTAKTGWRELWHRWSFGAAVKQGAFRKRLLDVNAFYWLAARARLKPIHVGTFLLCMAAWWLLGWMSAGALWLDLSITVLTALLLNSTLKVWVAIEAGQQLAEAQRTGAFELLLSAPLTVRDILRGQLLALRRQFLGPLLAVIAIELIFLWTLHRRSQNAEVLTTYAAGILMLVVDVVALSWVGMRMALTAKSHNHATLGTVVCVLLLPWGAFGAVVGVANLWSELVLDKEWSPGWKVYLGLWFGLGLGSDLLFGAGAAWQLLTRFRRLALRRFNPAPSLLARWFEGARTSGSDATLARRGAPAAIASAPVLAGPCAGPTPQQSERRSPNRRGPTASGCGSPGRRPALRLLTKLALLFCLVFFIVCVALIFLRSSRTPPPAIVVSITQSNAPLRVCSGASGVFVILPDGSLWRWGLEGGPGSFRASVPERVGSDCDWVQAVGAYNRCVGLRRDGTIWEWGRRSGSLVGGTPRSDPAQVDPGHDWVGIAASSAHSVALRRDGTLWAWGDNAMKQLGIGPGPAQTNLVQVGANHDWAAVCCPGACTLAVRTDGTLWCWGRVYVFEKGQTVMNDFPLPTRVCRETNWAGFIASPFSFPLVRTQSGELWEPFHALPNPEAPALSTCRLLFSNAPPQLVASVNSGAPKLYELRADGTLWETAYPFSSWAGTLADNWRKVGRRSDWMALFSGAGAAFGLASDGTLWTWGYDLGQEPVPDFLSRLKLFRLRVSAWFGARSAPARTYAAPPSQKLPRPLLRLVFTNSTPVN